MMRNRVDMEGNIMAAIIGSPTRYIQGKGRISLKSIHGFRLHKIPQGILRSEKQIWRSINAKPMEVMAIGKN